ncbi:Trp biosynthesis-associated membrane protein [Nonomuraea typhae]|uniref:Trp biosynthesis-associated membrane protein n=1 Tax=Nonomuraea typhae TaxID=2603600 RepID=UPI0012F8BD41|nr:Trp biosynthesis-associated membrane protein [Nonomuraea typhae]
MNRETWAWAAATAAGCLLVLLASGRAWVSAAAAGNPAAGSSVAEAAGSDLGHGLTAVGLASLAGVVAVLATKGAGRRVVGALLALCGAGLGWLIVDALSSGSIAAWARTVPALRAVASPVYTVAPFWPVAAGAGAVVVLVGGVLAVVRGGRWTGMSARYDRRPAGDGPADERSMWEALDRGDDPTG